MFSFLSNARQRFEYGAFGILKHQIFNFVLSLLIAISFIISTIRQMHYICCWAAYSFVNSFNSLISK